MSSWGVGRIWRSAGQVSNIGRNVWLPLAAATDSSAVRTDWKHQAFHVASSEWVDGANVLRTCSTNSSFTTKYCACASVSLLEGIISWLVAYVLKFIVDINRYGGLITYLITPRCTVLLEQLTGLQLVKKFPTFHGTRMFITALTSVRHLSLSWANPIQSTYPHPTSWRSILILSTHLLLGIPSGLFPSGFPTKTLYTPLSSPIHATYPAHLILLDFITCTILGEVYKSFSSSLCSLFHSLVTSSVLGPNILLTTMSSNTFSFLSSRNVNDQVSHPYKTAGKIIFRYGGLHMQISHLYQ